MSSNKLTINQDEKPFRELFFIQKLDRIKKYVMVFHPQSRADFRRDAKAVLCRGISDNEIKQVQRGFNLEDIFYYLSRIYIPCVFYYGYKVGHFEDSITSQEVMRVLKYGINMNIIAGIGYVLLRYYAKPVIDAHMEYSEFELQKRAKEDFVVQRNIFKSNEKRRNQIGAGFLKKE